MAETRLIQGRYRLLDMIGRGGMGEVWRARDESLDRHVAVKWLKPRGPAHDASFTRVLRERFRREARVAAGLQHRGVTVVHDFGEWDGVLFLVMELLDGRDLGRRLEDDGHRPLPVADVVEIADQVAGGRRPPPPPPPPHPPPQPPPPRPAGPPPPEKIEKRPPP
ncbi:protein kinase, partial [Streptomyces sp. NPDC059378]|uniref:protein kinase domain-containing protein n=1 Tax=Streptomyces sp. NPDC059378 TaxID=3346815 RepID=UPI003691748C